jgi:hypothetical protein
VPKGALQGTVTDAANGAPIAGALIAAGELHSTYTDADGFYQFQSIPEGVYDVTAMRYGYADGLAAGVVVTAENTTTQDFVLTPRPLAAVSGAVRDGAGGGWPLYARIEIAAPGYAATAFTDPVTGRYGISLTQGVTHTFTVSVLSGGYNSATRPVTPSAGGGMEDFTLTVDVVTCTAPGYQAAFQTLFAENFDGGAAPGLPAGWAQVDVAGTSGGWATAAGTVHPAGGGAASPPNLAYFNSYTAADGAATRLYRTTGVSLTSASDALVKVSMYHDIGYAGDNDRLQVQVSTDGGAQWADVAAAIARYDGSVGWRQHTVNLSAFAGQADVRLGLLGISAYGNDVHLDDIRIGIPICTSPEAGGLVVGNVYDGNTGLGLVAATVIHTATGQIATTSGTPADPAVADGFYQLFAPAGPQALSAARSGGYGAVAVAANVPDRGAIQQDFLLPAGRLSAEPLSLEVTLSLSQTTRAVTLSNAGGLAAGFNLQEINAPPTLLAPGPFAIQTRHLSPKRFDVRTLAGVAYYIEPPPAAQLTAGAVINVFPTGLASPWGIGFDLLADDLWVSNDASGGGDGRNHRFLPSGVHTGDTIDTTSWVASWNADMTFNYLTGKLWQVNVGGDNCIYEMDPVSKLSTGAKICPAFGLSQRGLAYDPVSDTYFAGSWNDSTIKRFGPDGAIVQSVNVGLAIAGLAYNPATGHLFVTANDDAGYDVYVVDVNAGYAVIGGFDIAGLGDFEQAGLEVSCDGHLWAVNQATRSVMEVESAEIGVCDWGGISWLTLSPSSGAVLAGANLPVSFTLDATGVATGTQRALVRIDNDTPYGSLVISVTMNVVEFIAVAPTIGARSVADGVELSWMQTQEGIVRYEVYRSTNPYFTPDSGEMLNPNVSPPGLGNQATFTDPFGEPHINHYYAVVAVGAGETKSPASNRVGAFHFTFVPGAQ